jgi:hypothetical protein
VFKILFFLIFWTQLLYAADVSKKTLYIDATIDLAKGTSWKDIGVTNGNNFIEVIKKSWKTWAETHFKKFDQVEIEPAPKDLLLLHPYSQVLRWYSAIKKIDEDNVEITAQYVLIAPKHNDILLSFSFPAQKMALDLSKKNEMSSKVASLIYNLLNSQTEKIKTIHNTITASTESSSFLVKIIGKMSLSEMMEISTVLQARFKELNLATTLQSFTSTEAGLYLRAKSSEDKLLLELVNAGKFPLNEQKLLLFNREDKSFAILPK